MKVFKFGGASIRDAAAIRNMAEIVRRYAGEPLVVVVSAMGKMTNAFEEVLRRKGDPQRQQEQISLIARYHQEIAEDLFGSAHEISTRIRLLMEEVREMTNRTMPANEWYDQVVSYGEILSSTIIQTWLEQAGIASAWLDARKCIITDDHFREGHILWELTHEALKKEVIPLSENGVVLTQGFLGGTRDGRTTTLGREGSDFTAAIIAASLRAESVTVWKDVDGIMSGDPKRIPDTVILPELPYREASEMTYYGASVIHPKTIKPLANVGIPLFVRSFYQPDQPGTIIRDTEEFSPVAVTILKDNQCLVSFYVRDFTFVNELNLSLIFHQLAEMDMKINMMQNSAISFSICVDYDEEKIGELRERLKGHFKIRFNTGLELVTVKHYTNTQLELYRNQTILLEQITRTTFQVLKDPGC